MREQIANMNSEIIHFKGTNDNMNLIVKDLVSKRNGMEKEVTELNTDEMSNLNYIKSFEYDISDMYQNFITVTLSLFRITKDLNLKLSKYIGSMCKRKTKNKWRESISRKNSSKKELTSNPLSRVSKRNLRRALNCTKPTTSES
jgi:hypothetical protein